MTKLAKVLGYFVLSTLILWAIGFVDVDLDITRHVDGQKILCIRGKEG